MSKKRKVSVIDSIDLTDAKPVDSDVEKGVTEWFKCPICQELATPPMISSCGHILCEQCVCENEIKECCECRSKSPYYTKCFTLNSYFQKSGATIKGYRKMKSSVGKLKMLADKSNRLAEAHIVDKLVTEFEDLATGGYYSKQISINSHSINKYTIKGFTVANNILQLLLERGFSLYNIKLFSFDDSISTKITLSTLSIKTNCNVLVSWE